MSEYNYFDSSIPPQSFLSIIYKRKKMILTLFLIVAGTITGAAFVMHPLFRASSKVMVKYDEDIYDSVLYKTTLPKAPSFYDKIGSELVYFRTSAVLAPVVTKLGFEVLDMDSDSADSDERARLSKEAVDYLAKNIKVEREKDTNVIGVSFEHKNPALAARIVDEVVKSYCAQRPILDQDENAYAFFNNQIKKLEKEIDEMSAREAAEKKKRLILSADDQTRIFFTEMGDFDKELTRVRADRIAKEARVKVIKNQLARGEDVAIPATETSDSPSQEDYLTELEKKKLELELRVEALSSTFRDEYPELAKTKLNLKQVKAKIRNEVERILDQEEASLWTLREQENDLVQKMNEIVDKIADLSHDQFELDKITIGKEDLKEVHSILVKQRKSALINQARLERYVRVRVIEPAVIPYKPAKPNKPLYAAIGVLLGFVVAFGFAFLLESLDHSLYTAEDTEIALRLPILTSIPEIREKDRGFTLTAGNGHGRKEMTDMEEPEWSKEVQEVN